MEAYSTDGTADGRNILNGGLPPSETEFMTKYSVPSDATN